MKYLFHWIRAMTPTLQVNKRGYLISKCQKTVKLIDANIADSLILLIEEKWIRLRSLKFQTKLSSK